MLKGVKVKVSPELSVCSMIPMLLSWMYMFGAMDTIINNAQRVYICNNFVASHD